MDLVELVGSLPNELKIKILYHSGFITKEADIIKSFFSNMLFKLEDVIYFKNSPSKSFPRLLTSCGYLVHNCYNNLLLDCIFCNIPYYILDSEDDYE